MAIFFSPSFLSWQILNFGLIFVCSRQALIDEKRRLEAKISELEDDLEEEHNNAEMQADKARKAQLQVKADWKHSVLNKTCIIYI